MKWMLVYIFVVAGCLGFVAQVSALNMYTETGQQLVVQAKEKATAGIITKYSPTSTETPNPKLTATATFTATPDAKATDTFTPGK